MNQQMMKQMQQLQGQIAKAQQELEETTIETSAGGGAVSVVMTAHPKINSITVQPEVVDPDDVEMLQDLIMAAVNEALEQIRATQMQQMAGIAGGLNIPGLTG
jgi:DNA-binding YbaB/EbfC family protein